MKIYYLHEIGDQTPRYVGSTTLKGRKYGSSEARKKAAQNASKGISIDEVIYPSIRDASRKTGISAGFICSVAKGNKKSYDHNIMYV